MKKITAVMMVFLCIPLFVSALSPEEILTKLESNFVYGTSRSTGRIIITDRFGKRQSSYLSYTKGKNTSMVEFTGKEDAGQKILRIKDEIYLYYPDAEEIIRLQGPALKQSILGSDMFYEDIAGDKSLLDSYNAVLEEEESINGIQCYRILLTAKKRNIPYQKQTMWIDSKHFIYVKINQRAKSGKVLKELTVRKFKTVSGHTIPVDILITDMLKKNSSTEFMIDSFQFNPSIPDGTFNLQGLW